jgi:hypothetical protein
MSVPFRKWDGAAAAPNYLFNADASFEFTCYPGLLNLSLETNSNQYKPWKPARY